MSYINVTVPDTSKSYTQQYGDTKTVDSGTSYPSYVQEQLEYAKSVQDSKETAELRGYFLDEAKKIVCNDRETQYGSPENNFQVIADLWQAYLGMDISPEDVAIMMTLMKIARIRSGSFKGDSWIDAIGYMACGAEVAKKHAGED